MTATRNRGELESAILNVLWASSEPLTAKQVQAAFTEKIPAITTLITVLDRMRAKGDVVRFSAGGRNNTFAAARTHVEHVTATMSAALSESNDPAAALLHFAGSLSEADREFLRLAITNNPDRTE